MLRDLSAGPRHWLELPKMRQQLERRCAAVQSLLAEGRRQGRFDLAVSDSEVMAADLCRIGSTITPTNGRPTLALALSLSLLNNSCSPNAEVRWRGPWAVLTCLQPIPAGDEVCVAYVEEMDHVLARRYFLLEQQGFRCLCARCQANFSGAASPALLGWRCHSCNASVHEESLDCASCGATVTPAVRRRREQLHAQALQRMGQAAQAAQAQGSAAGAGPLLEQALAEMREARPDGSTWLAKALSMLRSWSAHRAPAQAQKAQLALQEQRAAQRAALAWEAGARLPAPGAPPGDPWARRLAAALRAFEPSAAGRRKGRKRHAGPPEDGGYVVWDTGGRLCDGLLSYGVDTNVDFEMELANAGAKILLFDHTVTGPPKQHPNFTFRREALAEKDVAGVCGTFTSHLAGLNGKVMLKVDVEGAEFAALLATPPEVLAQFQQVCIELHWLGRPSRGGDFRAKALALERLNEHFVLLHVHGNSYGDLVEVAGCTVPDVLEALYVNRKLLGPEDVQPSLRGIPDPSLDANNCVFVPDVTLAGPPFGADLP